MISEHLLAGGVIDAINIGPGKESFVSVGDVADLVAKEFSRELGWETSSENHPHEAGLLALDATKATQLLGWSDKFKFDEAFTE
jgi:CDP-glucose 4,6-dehydratase